MKKLTIILALLTALAALPANALANSGPTYMEAAPGIQLAVDRGCPIEVDSEELTFDFSGEAYDLWAPEATVTASYEMTNPTDRDISVTMAFPTIAYIGEQSISSVTAAGEPVEYKVYYGDTVAIKSDVSPEDAENELAFLGLDGVLSSVVTECPPEPGIGTLYTVRAIPDDGVKFENDRYYIRLAFSLPDGSRALFDGGNSYSYENGRTEIGKTVYVSQKGDDTLAVYAMDGADIGELSVKAYEDYSGGEIDTVSFDIQKSETPFREFLERSFDALRYGEDVARSKLVDEVYWCFLRYGMEDALKQFNNAAPLDEMWSEAANRARLSMAAYSVDFAAGETKNVTVVSTLAGTMRRPSGYSNVGTTHTYTYLSNPAKNWASFGKLSITVIPPKQLPLSSSIPALAENGDGAYTASLTGLPEENIMFVLGEEATAEQLLELKAGKLSKSILPVILIIAAVVIIVLFAVRRAYVKKAKNTNKSE